MMQAALDTVSLFTRSNVQPPRTKSGTKEARFRAFGQEMTLLTDANARDGARRVEELTTLYERALASRTLPRSGVAVDLGAGDGWFGLSFARAFPQWQVICMEADGASFARLTANVEALGLSNVTCLRATIHPDLTGPLPMDPEAVMKAVQPAAFVPIPGLSPSLAPASNHQSEARPVTCPALPPEALARLNPDVLKLDAPYAEEAIADALKDSALHLLTGRLYAYVPSRAFAPSTGARELYLEHFDHVLRRDFEDNPTNGFPHRRPGLDIVVAMYNTSEFIEECVDSLLADGNPDVRVLVVDDGSTDGCGDLVARVYGDNPRVTLLRKANGGCASARNYGRRHSDASHIAFLDADDRVDPEMFTALLETARYTGAYVTEGEFAFLDMDEKGGESLRPSYEADLYAAPGDHAIGPYDYLWVQGRTICTGQPTIWRRVHRRDFLDRKNIWFPEHVRAFDDQIFQFLVGEYCGALAHVRGHQYHYRQHPAQDIKQGDERHFYSFNMFRTMIIRSLDEGWSDIRPLLTSLLNTMHWSYSGLRDDLKETYLEAAAKFLAIVSKTYGHHFTAEEIARTKINGLDFLLDRHLDEMRHEPVNYGLIRTENWFWQPEFIRMMQATRPENA